MYVDVGQRGGNAWFLVMKGLNCNELHAQNCFCIKGLHQHVFYAFRINLKNVYVA